MTRAQFSEIEYFTAAEVTRTGADLAAVQLELMERFDIFRRNIGCKVFFLKNGLTSGEHKSPEHPLGLGGDCIVEEPRPPHEIVDAAIDSGFDAIGIYHNSVAYSYHLGIRGRSAMWAATKTVSGEWHYRPLILDPRVR